MSNFPINDVIPQGSLIAVMTLEHLESAIPLAQALSQGGIHQIELTLRTPIALKAIERIAAKVPQMRIGAGTLLTADQVKAAQQAGASFGVAPGTNPRVIEAAQSLQFPFAPGVCTPTDIELALEHDCRLLKFFPCEASGGLAYLQQVGAPYAHLGVKFIPLGGIHLNNAAQYLQHPLIHAVGGSWIAPAELITQQDWKSITALAQQASQWHQSIH